MKTKVILIVVIVAAALLLLKEYREIFLSGKVELNNLQSIITGSCYINLKVNYKNATQTIVCPNDILYSSLQAGRKLYFLNFYNFKVGRIIKNKCSLEVNHQVFESLRYYALDSNLIVKYRDQNVLNDTAFVNSDYVNYNLDWEIQKVVIHKLLSENINCCYSCEGGIINIILTAGWN